MGAGVVTGSLQAGRGEHVPRAAMLTIRSAPGEQPQVPETEQTCPVVDGRWSCAVPAALLDLRLAAGDFIPAYFWNVRAAQAADVGVVTLVRGVEASRPGASMARVSGIGITLARRIALSEGPESMQDRLMDRFVHDSLRSGDYEETAALRWLSRLARAMTHRNRTVLAVADLQPSWLASPWSRVAYVVMTRLAIGAWIGVAAACFLGVLAHSATLAMDVIVDGIIGGIGLGILDAFLLARSDSHVAPPPSAAGQESPRDVGQESPPRAAAPHRFLTGNFAYALIAALAAAAAVLGGHIAFHQGALFAAPVFHGLLFALIVARPLATVRFDRDVAPVDALTWSWPSALRGWAGVAALSWLLLLFGRFSGLWPARAAGDTLWSSLPNSCFFAMVPATLLGLRPGVLDTKMRPNHGIWLSARNAAMSSALALIGCFVSIVLGVVFARFGWLGSVVMLRSVNMHPGVALFLAVGGCFAVLAALRFGGLDLVKHAVLRVLLWRQGLCPLLYPRFLEHVTRRGVLRRAGGGYFFFHSTLMSYLAAHSDR